MLSPNNWESSFQNIKYLLKFSCQNEENLKKKNNMIHKYYKHIRE
jgi:hypothetical protein